VHGEKPEKFNGLNFKRSQQKILFYLTTLNLAKFLTEKVLKLSDDESDPITMVAVNVWNHNVLYVKTTSSID
jgi:hypothetical protein